MDILNRIVDKCLSGRFILTLIGGVIFAWAAIHKQLEAAAVSAILTSIFNSYFFRSDRNKPEGGAK